MRDDVNGGVKCLVLILSGGEMFLILLVLVFLLFV